MTRHTEYRPLLDPEKFATNDNRAGLISRQMLRAQLREKAKHDVAKEYPTRVQRQPDGLLTALAYSETFPRRARRRVVKSMVGRWYHQITESLNGVGENQRRESLVMKLFHGLRGRIFGAPQDNSLAASVGK